MDMNQGVNKNSIILESFFCFFGVIMLGWYVWI